MTGVLAFVTIEIDKGAYYLVLEPIYLISPLSIKMNKELKKIEKTILNRWKEDKKTYKIGIMDLAGKYLDNYEFERYIELKLAYSRDIRREGENT